MLHNCPLPSLGVLIRNDVVGVTDKSQELVAVKTFVEGFVWVGHGTADQTSDIDGAAPPATLSGTDRGR